MLGTSPGNPSGYYLSSFSNEGLEDFHILVVDHCHLVLAEAADFAPFEAPNFFGLLRILFVRSWSEHFYSFLIMCVVRNGVLRHPPV